MKFSTAVLCLSTLVACSFAAAEVKLAKCPDAKVFCDINICELGTKEEKSAWNLKCMKSEMTPDQCNPDAANKCAFYKIFCDTGVCEKGTEEEKKAWFAKCLKSNLKEIKC